MKKIKPISIWSSGQVKLATKMHLSGNDNLISSIVFYYSLHSDIGERLADGNLTMSGDDYKSWQENQYAWEWVATKLGITILPDND